MSDIPANVVAAFKEFPEGDSIGVIQEYAWVHLTREIRTLTALI